MHTLELREWSFALADDPAAATKGFDDGAWRSVTVPHDWSVELDFTPDASSGTGYLPGGVAWYRAHVPVGALAATDGRQTRLVFAGVYKNAEVWANGYHLGGRPSGWARFSFDLTEILEYAPDDDLVIAVRVAHTDLADSRWYNGSGITRVVAIEVDEPVRVAELGTTVTTVSADATVAEVGVAQVLRNAADAAVVARVHHDLRSTATGRGADATSELEVPAGGSAELAVALRVPEPELWSHTDPGLYRLVTTITWAQDGAERQSVSEELVGIRTFRFDPDTGLSVNGVPTVLTGVCLHEDAGPLGTAVPAEVWLRRLLTLRGMGCNAVRMAHNPHAPELYALCDALGFYVIDEAFDEWENPKNKWWQGHNVYPPRHEGPAEHFPAWHERDLVDLIDAHRNHPSIIAWSIGNEIDYPNDPYASPLFDELTGNNDANKPAAERLYDPNRPDVRRLTPLASRLAAIVRRADPTRPVTLAAALPELSSLTGFLDDIDLIGYNYKEHLYEDDHRRFPHTPFVGSENGHRYADWMAVVRNDFVAGQFLWTGIDYLGEARGWPVHGSGAGELTLAGFEKHSWHLRRSWWSDEPTAYLVTRPRTADDGTERNFWSHPVARDWGGGGDAPVEVLCFVSDGEPTLSCDGVEIALTRDEEHGWWSGEARPGAAPLVLELRRGDEVVARDELHARGAAVRLDAVVWTSTADAARRCADAGIAVDGVVQLECTLVDEHGRVAGEDLEVRVEVEGGRLLGIENGDLGDVTPYSRPARRTLDGRLLVFVRPDGPATVRLRAAGLDETRTELPA